MMTIQDEEEEEEKRRRNGGGKSVVALDEVMKMEGVDLIYSRKSQSICVEEKESNQSVVENEAKTKASTLTPSLLSFVIKNPLLKHFCIF